MLHASTLERFVEAAKIGADVITAPPKIIHQLFKHPLTDKGIVQFKRDWEAARAAADESAKAARTGEPAKVG